MKEEIQSLKEYLVEKKEAHENGCVDSITLELWYENVQEIVNYITNLEQRIDKAIEYITTIKDEDIQYTIGWVKQDILQILDKEKV